MVILRLPKYLPGTGRGTARSAVVGLVEGDLAWINRAHLPRHGERTGSISGPRTPDQPLHHALSARSPSPCRGGTGGGTLGGVHAFRLAFASLHPEN
ncbi:hypothetical protein BH10PSE14_BH10PSE14_39540 [soil metagenome]